MAGNGSKWLEIAGMAENCLKWIEWLDRAGHGLNVWNWLETAGYGWIWLEMTRMAGNGYTVKCRIKLDGLFTVLTVYCSCKNLKRVLVDALGKSSAKKFSFLLDISQKWASPLPFGKLPKEKCFS